MVLGDRLEQPAATAEARSPLCGSRIQTDIAVDGDGRISAIALRANACALGQASAAILRRNAVGNSVPAIAAIRSQIADALSGASSMPDVWPELLLLGPATAYPSRHAAVLLPYDALISAADSLKTGG
jgi:NifU-like protein involved in Fe-S cluster formation